MAAQNCPQVIEELSKFLSPALGGAEVDGVILRPIPVAQRDISVDDIRGEVLDYAIQQLEDTALSHVTKWAVASMVADEVCAKTPTDVAINSLNEACKRELTSVCQQILGGAAQVGDAPSSNISVKAARNSRRTMEDRHVVIPDLNSVAHIKSQDKYEYYAVFDGHSGKDAANYCAAHLHLVLAAQLQTCEDIAVAIKDTFSMIDQKFCDRTSDVGRKAGCTAVIALIVNKKKLFVGWLGDSEAVLARNGSAEILVQPHQASNLAEQERIQKLGGEVVEFKGVFRVNSTLAVTRAIGDMSHKPYVSNVADVKAVELDDACDFLVLGSDGLFDPLSQKDVVVNGYHAALARSFDCSVAEQLCRTAIEKGSSDNITAVVVNLIDPKKWHFEAVVFPANTQEPIADRQPSNGDLMSTRSTITDTEPVQDVAADFVSNAVDMALSKVNEAVMGSPLVGVLSTEDDKDNAERLNPHAPEFVPGTTQPDGSQVPAIEPPGPPRATCPTMSKSESRDELVYEIEREIGQAPQAVQAVLVNLDSVARQTNGNACPPTASPGNNAHDTIQSDSDEELNSMIVHEEQPQPDIPLGELIVRDAHIHSIPEESPSEETAPSQLSDAPALLNGEKPLVAEPVLAADSSGATAPGGDAQTQDSAPVVESQEQEAPEVSIPDVLIDLAATIVPEAALLVSDAEEVEESAPQTSPSAPEGSVEEDGGRSAGPQAPESVSAGKVPEDVVAASLIMGPEVMDKRPDVPVAMPQADVPAKNDIKTDKPAPAPEATEPEVVGQESDDPVPVKPSEPSKPVEPQPTLDVEMPKIIGDAQETETGAPGDGGDIVAQVIETIFPTVPVQVDGENNEIKASDDCKNVVISEDLVDMASQVLDPLIVKELECGSPLDAACGVAGNEKKVQSETEYLLSGVHEEAIVPRSQPLLFDETGAPCGDFVETQQTGNSLVEAMETLSIDESPKIIDLIEKKSFQEPVVPTDDGNDAPLALGSVQEIMAKLSTTESKVEEPVAVPEIPDSVPEAEGVLDADSESDDNDAQEWSFVKPTTTTENSPLVTDLSPKVEIPPVVGSGSDTVAEPSAPSNVAPSKPLRAKPSPGPIKAAPARALSSKAPASKPAQSAGVTTKAVTKTITKRETNPVASISKTSAPKASAGPKAPVPARPIPAAAKAPVAQVGKTAVPKVPATKMSASKSTAEKSGPRAAPVPKPAPSQPKTGPLKTSTVPSKPLAKATTITAPKAAPKAASSVKSTVPSAASKPKVAASSAPKPPLKPAAPRTSLTARTTPTTKPPTSADATKKPLTTEATKTTAASRVAAARSAASSIRPAPPLAASKAPTKPKVAPAKVVPSKTGVKKVLEKAADSPKAVKSVKPKLDAEKPTESPVETPAVAGAETEKQTAELNGHSESAMNGDSKEVLAQIDIPPQS